MLLKIGILFCTIFLTQCLYTTHHFNTGRTLSPGKSNLALGIGRQPLWTCDKANPPDSLQSDKSDACTVTENSPLSDTVKIHSVFKGSIQYNLGLAEKLGPFPGLDLNWHIEAPTNPLSMEFGLRLELPSLINNKVRHSVDAGWGVGFWADNSIYGGYALSTPILNQLWFMNIRGTWLATQAGVIFQDGLSGPFPRNQRWVAQSGTGIILQLPSVVWIPDGVILQVHATYPQLPTGQREYENVDVSPLVWNANAGLLWSFM